MLSRTYQTMDGNQAAAHVAYAYTEAAAIYPITPSSPMAELVDEWTSKGHTNVFGKPVLVSEMQSEAGAAGAVHGALIAGALATTFTSSQGLLLMLPNLYRIAGELLPGVFHVAARTIATHALSIFGDHSDIYACRQSGAAILAESSVQEVMDLAPLAHLSAIEGRIPFLNFFDGFRTSHELQKIAVWDYQDLKDMLNLDAVERFRSNALHPTHGILRGSAQNPDIFFQAREASNPYYIALPQIIENNLNKINEKLGTSYGLFNYYGSPDATHVIIAMGSVCETIREYLEAFPDKTYGLINIHLYRPFSASHLLKVLPKSVKQITVLNRTKEPGSIGEPLYLDVLAALQGSAFQNVFLASGRYGLSSKDTTPAQIDAIYNNQTKKQFTVGITDDVTNLSLPTHENISTCPKDIISCKFWGLGGDGTISATKNIIKIIGKNTSLNTQGYFEYDSKKSRGLTISHLRFGKSPIRSSYLINSPDFVACHNPIYLHKFPMVQQLREGGTFLLNCYYKEADLEQYLPDDVKHFIATQNIKFYIIDAIQIGKEVGLNNKISTILQAAFFAVSKLLPLDEAKEYMKAAAKASYGKQGEAIVEKNYQAIEKGMTEVYEVSIPSHWRDITPQNEDDAPILPCSQGLADYVQSIQRPITYQKGNDLPVSAFLPYADGFTPPGSTAHERRNVATEIPSWKPENCIQCNLCSFTCPHAVVRPFALTPDEAQNAPDGMTMLPMAGLPDYSFAVAISSVDCTGCGTCAAVCPGKQGKKALEMVPIHERSEHQQYFDYGKSLPEKKEAVTRFKSSTIKGSQFLPPLMEFSGACAGCGETPYVKLLTQLFGPRMYIANATGCSSIWANSSPSTAYTVNKDGCGPAWSNSLFEDAAEFGFGMLMAKEVLSMHNPEKNADTIPWIIGGDGWAYDIGFSGLDHVLASGKNINILVLDTEVYSNTGGQASKSTPLGSTAKFISGGKKTRKKDLASIAMTYENVYVAQVAMGANYAQTVTALTEAAAHNGPSIVIAYATCIAHGIKSGMGTTPHEQKKAVETGYLHLFRYNPSLKEQNKNPFILDSKAPAGAYEEFLDGEIRYDVLKRQHPKEAKVLFDKASDEALERYQYLKKLEALHAPVSTEP
ncbi:MAG: pyruvate:ferredoxin (flavodoxin) oxidoreductase [Lachnospiraceae bacterium]|nr:pyruvate:ferredoxin (flavodoxin) oxidoreductase [Lachnospiraceae bacterium]